VADKLRNLFLLSPRSKGFFAALLLLAFAVSGHFLEHGWLGRGLYKFVMIFFPLAAGIELKRQFKIDRRGLIIAIASGIFLGAIAGTLIYFLLPHFANLSELKNGFDSRYHYTTCTVIIASLLIAGSNSFLEEFFYRGFLDDRAGIPVSAFIFALQHVVVLWGLAGSLTVILAGLIVFPAGILWSLVRLRCGLISAWISHLLTDIFLLGIGLLLLGYI